MGKPLNGTIDSDVPGWGSAHCFLGTSSPTVTAKWDTARAWASPSNSWLIHIWVSYVVGNVSCCPRLQGQFSKLGCLTIKPC